MFSNTVDLLNKKLLLRYIVALILIALAFIEAGQQNDFDIFLAASIDMVKGKDIFSMLYNELYHYYYSSFFALLIYPLTFIGDYTASLIWLLFNGLLLFRIWQLLLEYLPLNSWTDRLKMIFSIVVWLFMIRFIRDNYHLGQVTIFLLWICLESIRLSAKKRSLSAGFLLALGINIKILPIVVLPYLIYRKQFKTALFTIIGLLLLFVIPMLFLGVDRQMDLVGSRWILLDPLSSMRSLDVTERSYHSLTTLLSTLFYADARGTFSMDIRRHILDLPGDQVFMIIDIARISLILLFLFFLKWPPFKRASSELMKIWELSYLLLIIPLIFPHQLQYAFFFSLPTITYLSYRLFDDYLHRRKRINRLKKTVLISLCILLFFLLNSSFVLGEFNKYYNHFKTLTYGTLLLIPMLITLRPRLTKTRPSN